MKKLSLILSVITIVSLLLSSCANDGKESVSTTDTEITTAASTTGEPVSTTDEPAPDIIPEPKNPEPIKVGMTREEFVAVCEEMTAINQNFISIDNRIAFWVDENRNNAVAELSMVDNEYVVSIDRYFPAFPTQETFDKIREAENITIQDIVKVAGIPYKKGGTSGYSSVKFIDTSLTEHLVYLNSDNKCAVVASSDEGVAKRTFNELIELISDKYSVSSFEIQRVFVREAEEGKYKLCLQGSYGQEKNFWSKDFDINERSYSYYLNYRDVKNGVLYNSVLTDEYNFLYYTAPESLFSDLINKINAE